MIRKTLIATIALSFLAGPAFAFHCPADMTKIDAALPSAKLSSADKTKVRTLRAEGEAQHKAGRHFASIRTLGQAKKILGIK